VEGPRELKRAFPAPPQPPPQQGRLTSLGVLFGRRYLLADVGQRWSAAARRAGAAKRAAGCAPRVASEWLPAPRAGSNEKLLLLGSS